MTGFRSGMFTNQQTGQAMASDYYSLLGVERDADATTIKRAFRRRARELHPDVNDAADAEEQFRQVTTAYEVLSDDDRRRIYDQYGEEGLKQRQWEPQFASFGNIADIFSAFFGDDMFSNMRGGSRQGASRGENIGVNIRLPFDKAVLGTAYEINYSARVQCDGCEGSGAASDSAVERCNGCDGTGVVRTVARTLFGQMVQESACQQCGGGGTIITDPCNSCAGRGTVLSEESITVDIPAGVADGQRIRVPGRGHAAGQGGQPGNLYVDIEVEQDPRWIRDGDDLVTVLDLFVSEAVLGCEKTIETVDGDNVLIEVPAGIQPGEAVRVRGRGAGRLRSGGRGDLRLMINVQIPTELDEVQRSAMQEFAALEADRNYVRSEGLFDKVRRLFRS